MKISKIAILAFIVLGGLALMSHFKIMSATEATSTAIIPAKTWYSIQEVQQLQQENPKKVIVDIYRLV